MKKTNLMKVTALFFAFMLCFTILSRAADQLNIAVVTTERPQNRMIEHEVRAVGRVVQNQELAVTTLPDQRITAVYVREGEQVAKGDVLFEVDLTLLDEKILNQRQELEKQELQMQDAESRREVSRQQAAGAQAQAREQYALSTERAGVQLARAKRQLAQAQEKVKEFRESAGSPSTDDSVERALEQALSQRAEEYAKAQQKLSTLEWEIENAVYRARQDALAGASLQADQRTMTQSADVPGLIVEDAAPDIAEDAVEDAQSFGADFGSGGLEVVGAETVPDIVEDAAPDIAEDAVEEAQSFGADFGSVGLEIVGAETVPDTGSGNPGGDSPDGISGESGGSPAEEPEIVAGEIPGSDFRPPTQEELDRVEREIRESYRQELAEAEETAQKAKEAREEAEETLIRYQQEQMADGDETRAETARQLLADVQTARQAYEDASLAANEAAVTGGRAVQMADIPEASDHSGRVDEISYDQMELALGKLETLRDCGGKVCAGTDGLVTKVNVTTGEKTMDTTAILMADLAKGYRFTADITKDQQQYIGTGDLVQLTSADGRQKLDGLPVESVSADEADGELYHVTVQLSESAFRLGASVTMDFVRKSETYPMTVPINALHLDERRQPYVLVAEEYASVMGSGMCARRIDVTVLEQNGSFAALAEGMLNAQQEIIVQSDRAVDAGSRVRVGT